MSLFCTECGAANAEDASFCKKCGAAIADLSAPPMAAHPGQHAGPIWNPDAAANWSLLFTPAFGSYLHMRNWIALGQPEKASTAKVWFWVSLALLVAYVVMGLLGDGKSGVGRGVGAAFLITWYFVAAREQAKYVKEKLGKAYVRRPWTKALLLGVAGIAGYFVFAAVVGAVAGAW